MSPNDSSQEEKWKIVEHVGKQMKVQPIKFTYHEPKDSELQEHV